MPRGPWIGRCQVVDDEGEPRVVSEIAEVEPVLTPSIGTGVRPDTDRLRLDVEIEYHRNDVRPPFRHHGGEAPEELVFEEDALVLGESGVGHDASSARQSVARES